MSKWRVVECAHLQDPFCGVPPSSCITGARDGMRTAHAPPTRAAGVSTSAWHDAISKENTAHVVDMAAALTLRSRADGGVTFRFSISYFQTAK